ncbi:MAG: AAA family ATPase [Solobacterium sp.]|nr:AAA family ATPase [Solobacterium sp.]MBR3344101.1 AAA family ATPase [Solobacterium sp.]
MAETNTAEQQSFLNLVMTGKNILLLGGAGTGKTYIIRQATARLEKTGKNVLICAPTGVAAQKCGGTTIHRLFNIQTGPCLNVKRGTVTTHCPKVLEKTDVVIIDEISLVRVDMMDSMIASLQKAEKKTGKHIQLIMVGDFFQLPPVIDARNGEKELLEEHYGDIGHGFAFQARKWKELNLKTVIFHEIIRQSDYDFISNLNLLRKGDYSGMDYFNTHTSSREFQDGIYLTGRNREADELNNMMLERLPGTKVRYCAASAGMVNESDKVVPDELYLKKGARIMTVINDPAGQYVNGSTGVVTRLEKQAITVLLDGRRNETVIRPNEWKVITYKAEGDQVTAEVKGEYYQMPVKLAYAMTIHKAQGATFNHVNLNPYCWDCGQLYVALSRATQISGIYLTRKIKPKDICVDPQVLRFYKEIEQADTVQDHPATEPAETSLCSESRKPVIKDKPVKVKKRTDSRNKGGRPKKFGTKTCTIRIPTELNDQIQEALQVWRTDPQHMRIICTAE